MLEGCCSQYRREGEEVIVKAMRDASVVLERLLVGALAKRSTKGLTGVWVEANDCIT